DGRAPGKEKAEKLGGPLSFKKKKERPASVVKELLEAACDAGCRRIPLQVEAGGQELIQITDNACGMVRDDAMLVFFQAEDGIRDWSVTGVQTCALPI